MKKYIISTLLFAAMFFLFPISSFAADTIDQGAACVGGGGIGSNFMRDPNSYQTFIPTQNRLSKVIIPISIEGLVSQNISLKIYQGATLIVSKTVNNLPPSTGISTNVTFDFEDVTITPGATYKLVLSTSDAVAGSDWIVLTDCAPGVSFGWGVINPYDFAFTTYGWNYTAPVAAPTAPASNTTSTNRNTNNTSSNASNTQAQAQTATPTATSEPTPTTTENINTTSNANNTTPKKLTLVQTVFSKPIYWMTPLVILLLLFSGFLAFYELKLKPKNLNKKNLPTE